MGQAKDVGLALRCGPDGRTERFTFQLPADHRLAFLRRSIMTGVGRPPVSPGGASPFTAMVRELYPGPGVGVRGEVAGGTTADAAETWPTILVETTAAPGEHTRP
jgi:hypothetical protein